MKKFLPAIFMLVIAAFSCNMPSIIPANPALTPTDAATSTVTVTPTPVPTSTSTPVPTFTPTPLPEARIAEADQALFNGEYGSALNKYSLANDTSNDMGIRPAALLGQGRVHYLTGAYSDALNEFREVINSYPESPQVADAYYLMGETLMLLDRYSEAVEAFSSYLNKRPGVLDAFINERLGDAFFAAGDYAGALAAYTASLQSPRLPSNFQLEFKLAQCSMLLGDYATASVIYQDIFNRTGSENIKAQADYYQGQMLVAQGKTDEANAAYLDAVFNFPESYYSYLSLVELVNSGYPVDELQRGLVDFYAGQYNVALGAFERYLDSNPSDLSTALYHEGLIYRSLEDIATALALWEQVIQGDPLSEVWDSAWEQKAYTLWAYLGDYLAAEKTLLDFVAASPTHARAAEFLFDAGRVAERDGRLLDAAQIWQRMLAEYPGSDYVYQALFSAALCHYRLGDFQTAEIVFGQAQELAKTPAERAGAYFWTGKSQAARGDTNTARTTWQQATAIDPTGYYSERSRDMLADRQPFTSPQMIDLGMDRESEKRQAELWMQTTFNYPSGTDFSTPGPLASDPRFIRGMEFWNLGLEDQAEAEFSDLRESAANDPLTSYRLALYLSDLGMYRQGILAARQVLDLAGLDDAGTLTAPVLFSHIRFGSYFSDLVVPLAQENGFDPLFIWSTIRQESLFDPSIKSSAGAYGLMQIMPSTGEEIVSRLSWPPDYTQSDLLRPDVNLTLGVDYLATQRDRLGGDLYAALAAYNGGPGNAAVWQSLANGDPDLFVEIVRFDETRQYMKSIYELFTIYSRLYARVP